MKKNEVKKKLKYFLKFLPDTVYVNLYYKINLKKRLNLKNPHTFNEKLQWLKFNDRDPFYSIVSDKLKVRDFISRTIGEGYLIPCLGHWNSFDEINFDELPDKFVLKCNHDSGGIYICTNKATIDKKAAYKVISKSLKTDFYFIGREWQYKNIRRKIICEEFIGINNIPPEDYKISCFNGTPDNIMVCTDRDTGTPKFYFFDLDWNLLRYNFWGKKAPDGFSLPKPKNLEKMIQIAKQLSKPFYFARIDLYNIEGKIYFGEITLCPNSGFDNGLLPEADLKLGEKLKLPLLDEDYQFNFDAREISRL